MMRDEDIRAIVAREMEAQRNHIETAVKEDIRAIVAREMEAQRNHIETAVKNAVASALETYGFEISEKKETQADFRRLRRWRKSVERVEVVGWTAAIGVIVSGVLGALWLGIKTALGK